jgi:peptidoglycan/LPS O-acetylase OafA/YrhL
VRRPVPTPTSAPSPAGAPSSTDDLGVPDGLGVPGTGGREAAAADEAQTRPRLDALDGLRGAAALGIVVLHTWMFLVGDRVVEKGTTLDLVAGQLRLGMPMFFVLSAFLIFRPFAAAMIDGRPLPRLGVYALRRVARIGPAYWVGITLAFLVLLRFPAYAQPWSVLPTFLTFRQNYDLATVNVINPPSWTIAVEVTFYLAVPVAALLLAFVTRRLARPAHRRLLLAAFCVLLVVVGTAILGNALMDGLDRTARDTLPARLAPFGAGMLVAVLAHGRRIRRTAVSVALAALGVTLVGLEATAVVREWGSLELRQAVVDTPTSVGFALVIVAIATGRVPGSVVFARGPLQWYGKVSFGLYLAHFPVIWTLRGMERFPADPVEALLVVVGVSTVLAVASWHVLEKPAIAWAHRRTPKREPARRGVLAGAAGD